MSRRMVSAFSPCWPCTSFVGVQQLEGGGDIVFRKAAGLGQAFRVRFQPLADGGGGLLHRFQLFPALRVLHEVLFLFQHLRKAADGLKVQGVSAVSPCSGCAGAG